MDYDITTTECLCGSNVFRIAIAFDEDGEVSWYSEKMYCYGCGSRLFAPMPGVNYPLEV